MAFWIGFVLYLPALAWLGRALGPARAGGNTIFVAALAWMIAWTAIGYRKWNFRCPRCGDFFFQKFDSRPWRMSWQRNPFARHCMHCGLPKWASGDAGLMDSGSGSGAQDLPAGRGPTLQ